MNWTVVTDIPCPLPAPRVEVNSVHDVANTGTACLALMDTATVAQVWEDLLYDGYEHEHGEGGLMVNEASIGSHMDYDGDYPVLLHMDASGLTHRIEVDLDPYSGDLDSLRRPTDWTDSDEDGHVDGHGMGTFRDGWSTPVVVEWESNAALLGDPSGLPQADDTGGLIDIVFPSSGGVVRASVWARNGHRKFLVMAWSAA